VIPAALPVLLEESDRGIRIDAGDAETLIAQARGRPAVERPAKPAREWHR
jgi:hypothetical protein